MEADERILNELERLRQLFSDMNKHVSDLRKNSSTELGLLAQLSSKTATNKKNREPQFFLGHYDRAPMNKKHLLLNKGTDRARKISL